VSIERLSAYSAAREAVQQVPDVRAEKVDAIKRRVTDGTYHVPASVLARKLLESINAPRSAAQGIGARA
jgi:flagellar biosynthesis anti-sigma factor FlgM